ncbi:GPP34 family phosphoprotein [Streptomyces sp. YIM 130001]|uniref:GOLPH3/VPS74 family protein n=1 Tax=Streptomyces sp. YIM 130001 TaxID=2259644 RepID=UPI000E65CBF2|nr:GPP34 family phosphoprotein [Streptomyces sp. YIM 130001]
MTKLTLPEEFMLIALDDESGGGKTRPGIDYAVAGMALVQLALDHRVEVREDDTVSVLDPAASGVPVLDSVLAKAAGERDGVKVKTLLRRCRRGAVDGTLESLVARGALKKRTSRVLGLLPLTRYPEADGSAEREVRERLSAVVLGGAEPDERTAALVSVLHAARLRGKAFPDADRKQVNKRMDEVSEGQWIEPVVRQAVRRTRAAIIAASSGGGS